MRACECIPFAFGVIMDNDKHSKILVHKKSCLTDDMLDAIAAVTLIAIVVSGVVYWLNSM